MKPVFLYAGQGSQKEGMGKDFYESFPEYKEFVDSISLSFDAKQLMHEGPMEQLSLTEYTQPCMAIFAAGVTNLLKKRGIVPVAACGLSLGEYGALYAAGVFSAKDYIDLVAFRGSKMAEAAKGKDCSMSAILGLKRDVVDQVLAGCQDAGYVTISNYNCPGQYVICGEEEAVAKAETLMKEAGAKRCVRLAVSGPFHTKYMKSAGEQLATYFQNMNFRKPAIPVATNVTGEFFDAEVSDEEMKDALVKQVQTSINMENDLKSLIEAGYTDFIEIGPGDTLAGFLKKASRPLKAKVSCISIQTVDDFEQVIEKYN